MADPRANTSKPICGDCGWTLPVHRQDCRYALRPASVSVEDARIAETRQSIAAARKAVFKLAESGGKSWRMCVPPQPDDSDMLLCRALDQAEATIEYLLDCLQKGSPRG